jgi:hypothetical protein
MQAVSSKHLTTVKLDRYQLCTQTKATNYYHNVNARKDCNDITAVNQASFAHRQITQTNQLQSCGPLQTRFIRMHAALRKVDHYKYIALHSDKKDDAKSHTMVILTIWPNATPGFSSFTRSLFAFEYKKNALMFLLGLLGSFLGLRFFLGASSSSLM